ncbi:MAG: hypothetical protein ACRDBH_08225 [Bosea sp. (in: a-proteobacteria)]
MNEAMMYWDVDADGWSLRYLVAHWLADGTIAVCGEGDRPPRGSITIRGIEVEWVAAP